VTRSQWQCDLSMTGVLLQDGEARHRRLDVDGHMVPVLCLLVETESVSRGHALVEQPFPEGHMAQCEAAARRHKKGMRVTFDAPTVGIQLLVRNARHVHIHHDEPAQAEATTP
jgi:hypothetical protein